MDWEGLIYCCFSLTLSIYKAYWENYLKCCHYSFVFQSEQVRFTPLQTSIGQVSMCSDLAKESIQ